LFLSAGSPLAGTRRAPAPTIGPPHPHVDSKGKDVVDFQNRFVWYELITTDTETAKSFYADVVGWDTGEVSVPGTSYTLFGIGDISIGGLMELPQEAKDMGAPPHWIGYVSVDNVDAASERVKQLGGTVYVPPRDIPNFGRFSIVADPQMATLALLETSRGQEWHVEPNATGRVGWHELFAADWKKALAFYGELFGWQSAEATVGPLGTYQRFSVGGAAIGGMVTKPRKVPVPFWLYYFNVADIDVAAKRVKLGDGQIVNGPVEVPDGSWIVHCTDPQGAFFALVGKRSYKAKVVLEDPASRDVVGRRKPQ
jgi:predicted enzyme related to lactoylglutathione lyase